MVILNSLGFCQPVRDVLADGYAPRDHCITTDSAWTFTHDATVLPTIFNYITYFGWYPVCITAEDIFSCAETFILYPVDLVPDGGSFKNISCCQIDSGFTE